MNIKSQLTNCQGHGTMGVHMLYLHSSFLFPEAGRGMSFIRWYMWVYLPQSKALSDVTAHVV